MKLVRKLRSGADLYLGRTDSRGLEGTYENTDHHAEACRPFVELIAAVREDLNIKRWVEFNNVHRFTTHDGREYVFRPVFTDDYIGVKLCQLDGKVERTVFPITDTSDKAALIAYLDIVARPWPQETRPTDLKRMGVMVP